MNNALLAFSTNDLKKVANEKNVAVVATAIDILGLTPVEKATDTIWDESVDSQLLDEMHARISVADSPSTINILHRIEQESNISFFGVAVPSREPGEDDRPIATEDGGIETWGFGNVVRWVS
jgi:hypothetical protein